MSYKFRISFFPFLLLGKTRTWFSIKICERGGKLVGRSANKLRFGTFKDIVKEDIAKLQSNIVVER